MAEESRLNRGRLAALGDAVDRGGAGDGDDGDPSAILSVVPGPTYPTAPASVYRAEIQSIVSDQREGGASTIAGTGNFTLVANLGGTLIPGGVPFLAIKRDGIYTVRYDG